MHVNDFDPETMTITSSAIAELCLSGGKSRETRLQMSNSQSSLLHARTCFQPEGVEEEGEGDHHPRSHDSCRQQTSSSSSSCSPASHTLHPFSLGMETGALTMASFVILIPCCHGRDLVIRERTSGDQEVLAFLIGFILFLSILVIASLVSRCVWRDHRISSRRHLNPHGSLGQDSGMRMNPNSSENHSLYPRSRSFLSSLIHDNSDSDDYDDDEEEENDDVHDSRIHCSNPGPVNPNDSADHPRNHLSLPADMSAQEMRRQQQGNNTSSRANSSFSLSSAAFHLFGPSLSSTPSSSPSSIPLSVSSARAGASNFPVTRARKSEESESSMCDGSPVGERTHLIQYKRLCVRIKNPDTSCGSRHDPHSHSSNSISYL